MNEYEEKFHNAALSDFLDKKTIAAGLGLKLSLLDSKAHTGGGPPFKKENNASLYNKADAIAWCIEYSAKKRRPFHYGRSSPEFKKVNQNSTGDKL
jgi:hypothetical protein